MRAAQKVDLPAPAGPYFQSALGIGSYMARTRAHHDQRAELAHGVGRGVCAELLWRGDGARFCLKTLRK